MKFPSIAMVAAVAAISVTAHATTGMPSQHELAGQHVAGNPVPIDAGAGTELGSYGRYLMLNGKSRDEAIAEAANIDHPAARNGSPNRASPHAIATRAASAPSTQ